MSRYKPLFLSARIGLISTSLRLRISVFGFPTVLCLLVWAGGWGTRIMVGCVPNHIPFLSPCPVPTGMGDTPPLPVSGFANVIVCLAGGQRVRYKQRAQASLRLCLRLPRKAKPGAISGSQRWLETTKQSYTKLNPILPTHVVLSDREISSIQTRSASHHAHSEAKCVPVASCRDLKVVCYTDTCGCNSQ